jgi:adenylate cyclase
MDIHLEFERKWRLRELPALPWSRTLRIRQGYIVQGSRWVRVRETLFEDQSASHILCRKVRKGSAPVEMETPVSADAFALLWTLCTRNSLQKVRREWVDPLDRVWEFDEYAGPLAGLFTLELELPSLDVPVTLPEPIAAVLVAELTGDPAWSNRALAASGLPSSI